MNKNLVVEDVVEEGIEQIILFIRNQKAILDSDLASLYGVETKVLNQAVRRNLERFPDSFMFQLTKVELANLRFQFGTSRKIPNLRSQFVTSSYGGRRYLPYAFTEHGALMVATVLNSPRAVSMSLAIIRTFVKLRQISSVNKELLLRLKELESKYDEQFQVVFSAIKHLMEESEEANDIKKEKIGFI